MLFMFAILILKLSCLEIVLNTISLTPLQFGILLIKGLLILMKKNVNFKILLGILLIVLASIIYLTTYRNIDYSWYLGVFLYYVFLIILIISGLVALVIGAAENSPKLKLKLQQIILSTPVQFFLWLSGGFIVGFWNSNIILWLCISFSLFLLRKRMY